MLFDLLRLASIGQNMELLASLHQHHQARQPPPPPPHHQNHASQQQTQPHIRSQRLQRFRAHQNHQDFHCEEEFREENLVDNQPVMAQTNQCKPLDLTVKNATQRQARHSSNKIRPARLAPLVIEPHKLMVPNGLALKRTKVTSNLSHKHRKRVINRDGPQSASYQPQPPHSATKLISSSTSPSSCSRSVSASSNESKSCNDLMISSTNNNNNNINHILNSGSPTSDKLATQQAAASTTLNATTTAASTTTTSSSSTNKRQKHKNLKSHLCHQCGRSFSRSDMLTRHSRLHSGLKPYQCGKCKQVFSRSDHLSTHERTHTGEKPYQCERCAYSACRRDMITRHMRTHSASGLNDQPTRTVRRRGPKLLARATTNHFHSIKKFKCIKPEFDFEQEISSSSFEGDSSPITEEEESDDSDDHIVDLES